MMQTKDHVLEDAMKLPPGERLELAERLFASVDADAGVDEAWAEEVARRIAAVDSGAVKPIPWDEARKQIMG